MGATLKETFEIATIMLRELKILLAFSLWHYYSIAL